MNNESARKPHLAPSVISTLLVCLLACGALLVAGRVDYPALHVILDTGGFLLSGILALLFWDMGARLDRPLFKWMATSFAVTSVLEIIHVLVTVEWSGALAPIAQAAIVLRPSTWSPSAHALPVGLTCAILLGRSRAISLPWFFFAMIVFAASMLVIFRLLPQYTAPGWLGISRPTLLLVPLLWALVGWLGWQIRALERALPTFTLMAALLFLGHLSMLYSQSPHDTEAMVAHVGKFCGYLVILLTLMRMASSDMFELIRAEHELKEWNEGLERRVIERTAQLGAANESLLAEIAVRAQAEKKAHAKRERLNLLYQITRAIGERQDLKSIFQVVIRSVEDQLPIDFGCICLHEPGSDRVTVAHVGVRSEALALDLALTEQAHVVIDANGLSRCLRGQLVYEPDIAQVPMPFPQRLARGGLRSVVMAPLQVESHVFGVLIAGRKQPQGFESAECEFLRQLTEHVALATQQAQLYSALQQAYDDLHLTQHAIMQQERLRVIGQMASGIAHDINNALSPVMLYTEFLLETEPNLSERATGYLQTILRASGDVAKTVARMQEFYRQREPQLKLTPVQMNTLVQQVVDMTRARWSDIPLQSGSVIKVQTELAPELPVIMGVENEIREALINLVFNAADAMPAGGTLTLRTLAVPGRRTPDGALTSGQVHMEVIDTGVGMDAETRQHCMEPFFTTKGERGSGLGLGMVYGVAQRHSADLEIESEPGLGTTMRLVFAITELVNTDSGLSATQPAAVARQRILLVDDDPLLLKSLQDTLESHGHVTAITNGGQAGIDAFKAALQRGEPFNIVITDLGMPNVDGSKVAGAVKAASPLTPVILLTGWGQRLVDNGEVPKDVDRVLSKPPKLSELREALAWCCSTDYSRSA